MKKKLVTIILAGALTVSSAFTALAGWEQTGTTWKYQNADKTYMTNTWNWIDGNGDNVAECYYFGSDGIMLASTTVEGYTVNENGAWTVNGVVQTKVMGNNASTSHDNKTNTPTPESQPQTPENNPNYGTPGSTMSEEEYVNSLIPGWNGGIPDPDDLGGNPGAGGTWH